MSAKIRWTFPPDIFQAFIASASRQNCTPAISYFQKDIFVIFPHQKFIPGLFNLCWAYEQSEILLTMPSVEESFTDVKYTFIKYTLN